MSDNEIARLERELRRGNEAARIPLTWAAVRARRGFMIFWVVLEGMRFPPIEAVHVRISSNRFVPDFRGGLGLVVLDLADLARVSRAHPHHEDGTGPGQRGPLYRYTLELVDLEDGTNIFGTTRPPPAERIAAVRNFTPGDASFR